MKIIYRIVLPGILMLLTGCATHPGFYNQYSKTITGSALGAAGGALLGHAADNENGIYIGTASGALIGGALGYYMDGGFDQHRDKYRREDRRYRRNGRHAERQGEYTQTYPYR